MPESKYLSIRRACSYGEFMGPLGGHTNTHTHTKRKIERKQGHRDHTEM